MEALTRLVSDSLARHGLDRPVDPRRLQWSRWFRCDSPRSLLVVPSKPGIFAFAEEIMDLGQARSSAPDGSNSDAAVSSFAPVGRELLEKVGGPGAAPSATEAASRRMLAVLQFCEDDDMAFTLDRMFTRMNPMRERLAAGRCFLRFVVIQDQAQRGTICAALNQWLLSSAGKATGMGADIASSWEFTPEPAARAVSSPNPVRGAGGHRGAAAEGITSAVPSSPKANFATPNRLAHLDSTAAKNLHCPQPFPSGF